MNKPGGFVPRMLTCYVCGTQHGLNSLVIHQKQCIRKYNKSHRKPLKSSPPSLPIPSPKAKMPEVEAYNAEASAIHASAMPKCAKCGRTFATDEKVAKHSKACKGAGGGVPPKPAAAEKTKDQLEAKRIFDLIDTSKDGLVSLEELMLYLLDQGMEVDEISELFQGLDEDHDGVLTLEEWEKGFAAYKAGMDKTGVRMLVCYVCGGQHGIASLLIHQKQCLANYEKCNGHPFAGPPPELPVPGQNAKMAEVIAYNAQAQALYSGTMPACPSCGRKFATQAKVDQHSKTCKGGTSAQFLQKGSGGGGGVKGKVAVMAGGGTEWHSADDTRQGSGAADEAAAAAESPQGSSNSSGIRDCMTEAPAALADCTRDSGVCSPNSAVAL